MAAAGRAPADLRAYTLPGEAQPRAPSRRGRHTRRRSKSRVRAVVATAAAACAVALAAPGVSLHLSADHITRPGHVEQVRLADGSTVHLGPDSAIAIDYDGARRTVRLLAGQAMFDVTRDPDRPFRVAAGTVTTTVLGTRFDVRMIGGETSVSVSQGHVQVEDEGTSPSTQRDLLAGDWIRIGGSRPAETGRIAPQLVGGWKRGEVLAENRSIASLIDEIRPWYGGRIIVTDADLANRPVTGIYDLRQPVQALSMIVQPYGGRVTRITPWLLIVSG
nr:FecR domain-containing protein [Sandaracinobacteroides sayramensis]